MADTTKITETMVLNTLRSLVTGAEQLPYDNVYMEDCVEWIDKKLAQKEAKAEAARQKRAERAKENDVLIAKVQDILTENGGWMSAQEVTDVLGDPEVSKSKTQYRLSKLVADEVAVKEVRREGKTQMTVYKIA